MTREETQQLLLAISSIYPNFEVKDKTLAVDTWQWALGEYPIGTVKAALQIYVKTSNTGFAPSVSQLIGCIHAPADHSRMSEGEAWALVKKAIQDGNYHSEERFAELPETVQKAIGGASMLRQWAQTDSEDVNTVIMSNFQRAYRTVSQREEFSEKVPEELADLVRELSDKTAPRIGAQS